MNIRPKTLRRLLILFAATTAFLGILICVIIISVSRNARTMKKIRVEAMTAFRAGDYVKSVELFQTYREMAGATDPDAEFAYGVSRVHVEMPNGKHLIEGIHIFERYLQSLKPGDPEAERQLLQLYVGADISPRRFTPPTICWRSIRGMERRCTKRYWRWWANISRRRRWRSMRSSMRSSRLICAGRLSRSCCWRR